MTKHDLEDAQRLCENARREDLTLDVLTGLGISALWLLPSLVSEVKRLQSLHNASALPPLPEGLQDWLERKT